MFGASSEPASVMEFGREPASNMFRASSELAGVMEFGFKTPKHVRSHALAHNTHVIATSNGFTSVSTLVT